ncbi:hypothetical protein V2J09_011250 [Rumex salicifolius]
MAASCLNIQSFFTKPQLFSRPNPLQLHTTTAITINRHFPFHIHPSHLSLIQSRSREFSARIMPRFGVGNCAPGQHNPDNTMGSWIGLFRSFAPGGDWWKLGGSMEVGDGKGTSATVPSALWRIWLLVSDDRWIIISAFASLTIAALSEISMPSLLAASIFAVNNAESVVARDTFYLVRTVRVHGAEDKEVGRYEHWLNKIAFINLRESIAYGLWNLSFNFLYRSTQIPVLKHVNITIQANEVVAIVGLSGSGKSSLIKLLLRLYEPTDGEIKIDGVPISKLDVRWLRDHMGYVGQEPALMHMDVKSNISYGNRGNIRHDDIVTAAKLAYAHNFISSLPSGYDTVVNDDLLSGGQKQRIAIARAILRNPKILILDEPTSALDVESEHYVTGVLQALKADSSARGTVIVIAHRSLISSTSSRMQPLFLVIHYQVCGQDSSMDGGKIVEMGNHKELLKKKGVYSRLAEMQSQV